MEEIRALGMLECWEISVLLTALLNISTTYYAYFVLIALKSRIEYCSL